MRLYPFAAALLLGGSCALAGAPTYQPVGEGVADAAARLYANMADQYAGNPDLDLAVDPNAVETAATDASDARADGIAQGIGGPYEPVEEAAPAATTIAALDTTTRPAAQNYPACDPGPGDDSCIQLYEPGVRVALASWIQPTGGFTDSPATATAMGGPYEPVEAAHEVALVGDGTVAYALGETDADEVILAMASATEADYTGMGGPIAETGYPACSATVTDRCIQLYERGVTGAGN
jgi:hypothetical protein